MNDVNITDLLFFSIGLKLKVLKRCVKGFQNFENSLITMVLKSNSFIKKDNCFFFQKQDTSFFDRSIQPLYD